MKRTARLIALAVLLTLFALPARAVKIDLGSEKTPFEVYDTTDASPAALDARYVDVIAEDGDFTLVVLGQDDRAELGVKYVKTAALSAQLGDSADTIYAMAAADCKLPDVKRPERSDAAREVQAALFELNYLTWGVDGDFGAGSERALIAFNERYFPAAADPAVATGLSRSLLNALSKPVTELTTLPLSSFVPPTPESTFPQVYARLTDSVDLQPFCTKAYAFTYDDFEQRGVITLGAPSTHNIDTRPVISQMSFVLSFGVKLTPIVGYDLTASPCIFLSAQGSRRPYIAAITLKLGESVFDITPENIQSAVDGGKVTESMEILPNAAAITKISESASPASSAALRIEGKYQRYEFALTAPELAALKQWSADCLAANLPSQPALKEGGGVSPR